MAAKAARSCPEAYLEAARRGHRDKARACSPALTCPCIACARAACLLGALPQPAAPPPARPRLSQVKECFVIDLDVDAYMAAAQGAAAARDFYVGRMVLSEGARVRCADPATGREVRGVQGQHAALLLRCWPVQAQGGRWVGTCSRHRCITSHEPGCPPIRRPGAP